MANTIKIKRRPASGSAGKPSSLYNGELAFNENDNILYYGYGSGIGGVASSIEQIGGTGYFATRGGTNASGLWPVSVTGNAGTVTDGVYTTGTQTITGSKTFTGITYFGKSGVAEGNIVLKNQFGVSSADWSPAYGLVLLNDGLANNGTNPITIQSAIGAEYFSINQSGAVALRAINTSSNNVGYFAVFDSNPASSTQTLKSVSKSDVLDDIGGASSGISMTAGSGLVGGGNLTQSRTFDIGQGDGITVNVDSIAVDNTVVRTSGTQIINGSLNLSDFGFNYSNYQIIMGSPQTVALDSNSTNGNFYSGQWTGGILTLSVADAADSNSLSNVLVLTPHGLLFPDSSVQSTAWLGSTTASNITDFNQAVSGVSGVLSSITFTAGSGLVGGGTLSSNRTFNVGQGDGISVNTDSIAVDDTVVRTTGNQDINGAKTLYDSTNNYSLFSTVSDVVKVKAPNTNDTTYYFLGLNGGGSPPSSVDADRSLVSRSASQVKSDLSLNNVTNDAQIKKLVSTSGGFVPTWNGTSGDALNIGYSVETTLTGGSSSLPRSDAVKTYIDALLGANDAMVFKGTLGTGGTITSLPTTYSAGWTYRVITAGTYAGVVCEVGDLIIAVVDRSGSGNVNSDWTVAQTNIDGAVITTRTLTAGNGLTGGGDLSADRTFNVGAGDGISVDADAVAVDSTVVRTTGVQNITGAKNFSGNIVSSGTLSLKMATTSSTATQFPVFVADPSSSAQNVLTRTPSQVKTDIGLSNVENTALSTWAGSSNITTLGTISTGTWSATTIAVNKGGTGQTSYTDGQLLIGNSTGNTLSKATLTAGTSVDITNGAGSISIGHSDTSTLSGAQGSNGIASITVDGLGHVTAVTTATYLTAGTVCAAIVDCTLDGGSF